MSQHPRAGTPTGGTTQEDITAAAERAQVEGISLVWFLYADHGGIIRGKAAGTARLRERMSSGIGHTVAMMAMSMLDQLQPVAGMGPVGEVRIVDLATGNVVARGRGHTEHLRAVAFSPDGRTVA